MERRYRAKITSPRTVIHNRLGAISMMVHCLRGREQIISPLDLILEKKLKEINV